VWPRRNGSAGAAPVFSPLLPLTMAAAATARAVAESGEGGARANTNNNNNNNNNNTATAPHKPTSNRSRVRAINESRCLFVARLGNAGEPALREV
jgi:hypothetical protein